MFFYVDRKIDWHCEGIDFSDDPFGVQCAQTTYFYYLLKVLDLLDTVFFVLRKKSSHVSFLHVYHHCAVLIGSYVAVNWAPGESAHWSFSQHSI